MGDPGGARAEVTMRNDRYFHEVVGGRFGRKIAYADYDAVDAGNILDVLSGTVGTFNRNRAAISYLWNYKNGDQPSLYRTKTIRDDIVNRVVENHAWEVVRFKNAQTYGEPVQYVSLRKDVATGEAVDRLNDVMRAAGKARKDVDSGEWTSAVGTGFKAIQRKDGAVPFRIVTPSPLTTYAVYSRLTDEHVLSVQQVKAKDGHQWLCYSPTHEFLVRDGKLLDTRPHGFGGIPIVEYPNNQDRISDIELVISMLDAINGMQSNRMDAIEQFVQSWVKFVNCEVDEELFQRMKMSGALVVKSNNNESNKADVDIITQELNQTESQVAKEDLWNNVLNILAIPNKQDNTGGDTQGAVRLRNGWDVSAQAARIKDQYVVEGDKRLAVLAMNAMRLSGEDIGLGEMDFDANVSHSPTDNMFTKAEALQLLLQSGISPQVAIRTSGLWTDSEKVFLESKPFLDGLYGARLDDTELGQAEPAPQV